MVSGHNLMWKCDCIDWYFLTDFDILTFSFLIWILLLMLDQSRIYGISIIVMTFYENLCDVINVIRATKYYS